MTIDDHKVALRSCRLRPEKCCEGVRDLVRLPPVELDDALALHAPCFEVRADA